MADQALSKAIHQTYTHFPRYAKALPNPRATNHRLQQLFHEALSNGKVPCEWQIALITPISK